VLASQGGTDAPPYATVVGDVIAILTLEEMPEHRIADPAIPIKVNFDENGNPTYPMSLENITSIGAEPHSYGSDIRYDLYKEEYDKLSNDDTNLRNVSDEARQKLINLLVKLHFAYGDQIDTSLTTELYTEMIDMAQDLAQNGTNDQHQS
jgi:hypothetical protein